MAPRHEDRRGFYAWTPETIAAERARYDRLLRAGLDLIAPELPEISHDPRRRSQAAGAAPAAGRIPVIITVAPNRRHKQAADHPAVPLTAEALGRRRAPAWTPARP